MYFLYLGILSYYVNQGAVTLLTLKKKSFHLNYNLLENYGQLKTGN